MFYKHISPIFVSVATKQPPVTPPLTTTTMNKSEILNQIPAELRELAIAYAVAPEDSVDVVKDSTSAANLFAAAIGTKEVEYFSVAFLNQSNTVIDVEHGMFKGGIASIIIDVRVVFKAAILKGACAIIVSHNHPGGGIKPSQADKNITKKLAAAGEILDVQVLDHIIVTGKEGKYYSFADAGMM